MENHTACKESNCKCQCYQCANDHEFARIEQAATNLHTTGSNCMGPRIIAMMAIMEKKFYIEPHQKEERMRLLEALKEASLEK